MADLFYSRPIDYLQRTSCAFSKCSGGNGSEFLLDFSHITICSPPILPYEFSYLLNRTRLAVHTVFYFLDHFRVQHTMNKISFYLKFCFSTTLQTTFCQ